jgi:hypothetical protein
VKQHSFRLSDKAWRQIQAEAKADRRSIGTFLDVFFSERADAKQETAPAQPRATLKASEVGRLAYSPIGPLTVNGVDMDYDDDIVHEPALPEA